MKESGEKSEAVHSLTSSEGTPPFLFQGRFPGSKECNVKGCNVKGQISADVINWLPRQVFSTDTLPDFSASSVSLCQARCKKHVRTHLVEKQRSERKEHRYERHQEL